MNAIVILGLSALATGMQDRPAGEAKPLDASGYFHLGEFYTAELYAYYFQVEGAKIGERTGAFESEARRLGAPSSVLENLAAYHKGRLALPFLARPMTSWTAEESRQWDEAPKLAEDAWTAWLDGADPDHAARLFWHLGRMSLFCWFYLGNDVLERDVALKAYEKSLHEQARLAGVFLNDPYYARARERLSPKAAAALKAVADLEGPMEDPFGEGVTMDHLRAIDASARALRDLARSHELTTDAAPAP